MKISTLPPQPNSIIETFEGEVANFLLSGLGYTKIGTGGSNCSVT